ncbi:serine hydrolase [Polaribacter aestuariivivens]|uniref:Serine hydrolase n=1 Tax=Polaribacter aestuariivivens TaxID=2304626 RepID=A0A5S3N1M8_9FLAO|nr:serine hydrolase [Polaribacter aestuariivivens]TMM28652.1 serine hydrolase [Polaribacter aestuariivivens]
MKIKYIILTILVVASLGFIKYPIDGYETTGIKRLYQLRKMQLDSVKYTRIPAGAYKKLADIKLNLLERSDDSVQDLLITDKDFEKKLKRIIPSGAYSLAAMDMTNPNKLRYAEHRENVGYQPGSVGKIAVLLAVFDQLEKLCPDSWEDRAGYLKNIKVTSRYWGTGDHHTIPVYDIEKDKLTKRRVIASDEFSLYEWLDHMVSVSNNGAASVMYREAMLMAAFGQDYFFLDAEKAEKYFKETSRDSLTNLANTVVNEPLRKLGIEENEWKLGGMFTRGPEKYVGRKGGSIGTPKGLMKFLVKLEQGNVVDKESSLEMKRLLYLTDRRIRYAKSPRLDSAAVYFKSGSYYKCDRVKNPDCASYAGNVFNFMNSVIIVEHPNGLKYIVCLMSNVLNKNSAGAHMYLASKIDDIIDEANVSKKPIIKEEEYKADKDESDN